ncbi:STAS domain-containing protein [Polymorphospora sp. NPDC050346]|uniref:STAS domain-containing protein n=1 Tax=Polymorphospora sp. NPDC050346 TaxID=3155780 RepID=UPI00340CC2AA
MGDAVVNQQKLDDGTVVVELRGELDLATNDALRAMLVDLVEAQRPPRIVVDLLHVSFVDSTGIGALLAGYNAAIDSGVGYRVRAVAPFVERQLRLTGVYGQLVSP